MDPQKIEDVTQWPKPKNVTKVRSFLGLAGIITSSSKTFLGLLLSLLTWQRRPQGMNGSTIVKKLLGA